MKLMKGKVDAAVFVDYENKIIHILDLDQGGLTVTNAMGKALQLEILSKNQKTVHDEINQWIWYCYGTDGIIAEYQDGSFTRSIAINNIYAHPPFAKAMEPRRERYIM